MTQSNYTATLTFALCLSIFGLFSLRLTLQNIDIITPHLESVCLLEPLPFTHYIPLDQLLCGIVIFFQRAMDDYMGLQVTRIILGTFGTVQAIMAVEGSRIGYSRYHLLSWFMLWGMIANLYTIAVVSSLIWIPLLVLTSRSFVSRIQKSDGNTVFVGHNTIPAIISPARSYAILLSLVIMYGIPTFLMVTTFAAERGTWVSLQITCFWQFCPIFIQLFYIVCTWIFEPLWAMESLVMVGALESNSTTLSSSDRKTTTTTIAINTSSYSTPATATVNETDRDVEMVNQQRQQTRMAQSKAAMEKLYLTLLIINLFIYYGSILQMWIAGIDLKNSIISLATKTPPVTGLGDLEINKFFSAHILMLDLAVVTLTYALWSLYEDGVLVFFAVGLGIILIGPGGSIATYALYREQQRQDRQYLKMVAKKTS